ncbi:MAG: hypothetical protein KAJ23_02250 [Maribacter sp.]|nr:hypothetical protein [Maribacter sp.]
MKLDIGWIYCMSLIISKTEDIVKSMIKITYIIKLLASIVKSAKRRS